jgi:hypothetical protein
MHRTRTNMHHAPDNAPAPAARADWDAVERDYRTGKFSNRELGAMHGCSHTQVSRRAKLGGWERDLRDVIRKAASTAVIRATVAKRLDSAANVIPATADTVMVAAEIAKDVILRHRSDLQRTRDTSMRLLQELEACAMQPEHVETLARVMGGDDDAAIAEARKAITRALGIGSRITGVKALADALVKLQVAERLAFDLDADGAGDDADKPKARVQVEFITPRQP